MSAYYNENDPYAAQWLRNLIASGLIAPGEVDDRSIEDVRPDDLRGFTQCHFFAGIGGWSYALRLAGWPDDRPVWTGSCPCQPYSVGSVAHGGAKGQRDERDLWPDFFRLIAERKPSELFGEQVASAIAWGWWDRAAMDLEGTGYACAAAVLPAYAVGARHERKRLCFVALAGRTGRAGHKPVERIPFPAPASLPEHGSPLARAGRALDGDYSDLLPCDGLPVAVERCAAKGYGNAIVPQAAAAFIEAYLDAIQHLQQSRAA
jgi:DNA (cytosine-5)-methyltransferase 1